MKSPIAATLPALLPLAALLPGAALAQPSEERWRDDQTITVTAARAERGTDETPQSISILTDAEIEARQSATVLDLLATLPGITTTRSGGPGTIASVSIRGAESDHTLVLIDGMKINDPASTAGGYDFGALLTGNIERIEVVRGPRSVLYGSQAIGGVVNLITRSPRPGEPIAIDARAEAGGRETWNASANVAAAVGPVAASLGGGWYRTGGFSAFNVRRGGEERDGYEQWHANGRIRIALGDHAGIDLRGSIADGRADLDGYTPSFEFGDTLEYSDRRDLTGYAGFNFVLGPLASRIGYAATRVERTNHDPQGFAPISFESVGTNERLEYQGVARLGFVDAVFGAEREWSRFDSASSFPPADAGRATLTSFYGELSARPVTGLTLTGGVRHDDHDRFGGATVFSAGGVFTPNDGATRIRASYGEGFKVPSLYQLYSQYGNAALRPENSESWEVGVDQRLMDGAVELGAVYFRRDADDLIDYFSCPFDDPPPQCAGRYGYYDNIKSTRAEGFELTMALKPVERLSVVGQYSFVDAKDRTTGNKLARRPRHTVSATVDYAWPFGLATGATIAHVGDRFDNAANSMRVDGHALVDIRASFPLTPNVELYGRVENLFDERYEVIANYGTPGRAAFGGVRVKL